jgi:2-haloacid dehalogenase
MRAVLFDVFGTLLDVHSVQARADSFWPGRGAELSQLWRTRQIDYSRLHTMAGRFAPFTALTRDALEFAVEALRLPATFAQLSALMAQYERLAAFPEARNVLVHLRDRGVPVGVLSNGDAALLETTLASAGLRPLLTHVLSADEPRQFKVAPAVYALGPRALGLPAADILFVSSNGWDAAGATWYGYVACWINRGGAPMERLGVAPAFTGATLDRVTEVLFGEAR